MPERAAETDPKNRVFRMKDVVDYMEQHLGEKLSASEMAGMMAVSYSSFGKQFRAYIGMSFSAYLLWRRMERAKDYLANSHMKIKQVASKVGYHENPQHFSRDFTRQTGISPKEYRVQMFRGRQPDKGDGTEEHEMRR